MIIKNPKMFLQGIKSSERIYTDMMFEISNSEIRFYGLDPFAICYADLRFGVKDSISEIKKYIIDIDEIFEVTKKIKLKKHDTIQLKINPHLYNQDLEIYKNSKRVGTIPLVNPDEGDEIHDKEIRLKSKFDFDINTVTFAQAVNTIKKYTDLDIKITITNRPVVIYQNEEENHGIKKYDKIMIVHNFGAWQGRPDKIIKSRYDVEYLSDILLAHKLFEYVNLKIATNYPLTISSKTINDDVKFKHFLAPRVPTE